MYSPFLFNNSVLLIYKIYANSVRILCSLPVPRDNQASMRGGDSVEQERLAEDGKT